MNKTTAISILFIFLYLATAGQSQKGEIDLSRVPEPRLHYQEEYDFDSPVEPARWQNQKHGLHVSFASTDRVHFRTEVPDVDGLVSWHGTGWRGERLNGIILVWSPDTLTQVRFSVSDLTSPKGQKVEKKNIQLNMVRYVISNYPYNAPDAICDASPHKNLYLMPDRFEAFDRFDLPGRTVRPVWFSIDIPSATEPGDYSGTMEVQSEKFKTSLQVQIKVQKQILPEPGEWKFRLDLWQNPWVVAWYNHVKPWSPEHLMLLRKHLSLYAGAGGKYITTYAVHSPWQDNSYMIEEAMIEWTKKENGSWNFDYTIFDQYVSLAMEAGVNKAITIYTPVPWGNRFRYLDEKTGNYIYETWEPGSPQFKSAWDAFLTDLQTHLGKKGWLEKTFLGINENTLEQTLATIKVIRDHSAKWKITYAGNWHKELDSLLNDYCFLYGEEPEVSIVKERSSKGFTSTYYICCNPPKPNDFVFSPPAEGRWLGWYSAAHGYDGFLRWAYDAWPVDPARDARHVIWPAGDCFLVYPGGASCIRFEKLREGIADYEKIMILKKQAANSRDNDVNVLLSALDSHLQSLLLEKDFKTDMIIAELEKGKKLMEDLSAKLEK